MIELRHISEPDTATEARDQREFDEAVKHEGKLVLEGALGAGVLAALVMSALALAGSGAGSTRVAAAAAHPAAAAQPAAAGVSAPAQVDRLSIVAEAKPGPEGQKHDALTQTEFRVKAGQQLKLVVNNTDEGDHSITAPGAGINIDIKPGVHTYTLTIDKPGVYSWLCAIPCDDWAMAHSGYMAGYITVTS